MTEMRTGLGNKLLEIRKKALANGMITKGIDEILLSLNKGERDMKNIEIEVKGSIMTVTIDLSKQFGRSASGKTTIIATTAGNVEVAPGVNLGVNCYKK